MAITFNLFEINCHEFGKNQESVAICRESVASLNSSFARFETEIQKSSTKSHVVLAGQQSNCEMTQVHSNIVFI